MTPKRNGCPRFWVRIPVLILLIALAAATFVPLPKPLRVSDSSYDLMALEDGAYQGQCDNGLVFARVEIKVENHRIANVRILEHRNGRGRAAETVADSVVENQSIEVDTVSGATISSQTILKAIENALSN